MSEKIWQAGRFELNCSVSQIMGIVNITPDSFSDGGQYSGSVSSALKHAEQLLRDGATILDIGGESTRPGAESISREEEWQRIAPVLEEVSQWNVPISLDTRHTDIMRKSLDKQWVDIINDVQGLEDDGAIEVLAQSKATGICLMHMQGLPENMQNSPSYDDVLSEVTTYLQNRMTACLNAGIESRRLVVDPGFGFGKTLNHNIALLQNLDALGHLLQCPILIGLSRKRMIGEILNQSQVSERMMGSVIAALFGIVKGAAIVRVHDVKATRDALTMWEVLTNKVGNA